MDCSNPRKGVFVGSYSLYCICSDRVVMKHQEVLRAKRKESVSPSLVVTELDFKDITSKDFHNCSNLATDKLPLWKIPVQRDHIQ